MTASRNDASSAQDIASAGSAASASLDRLPSSTARSIASLLLVIHLFCVAVCFFSVIERAPLPYRLLGVLAPYVQLFNFDLDFTPFYLTRDSLTPEDMEQFFEREYRVEVLPEGAAPDDETAWVKVGERWWGSGENYRRLQRLAFVPVRENRDERQASVAMGMARAGEAQLGQPIARVRIRQHLPMPREAMVDPDPIPVDDPFWFRVSYEALIVDGKVLPVVSTGEAAPATSGSTSGSSTSGGSTSAGPAAEPGPTTGDVIVPDDSSDETP